MEDAEGGLSFDFEGGLETGAATVNPPSLGPSIISNDPTLPTTSVLEPVNNTAGQKPPTQSNRRSFRQTVCRHWLRSLCMKGDACGFLHQFDKARMPVCRFFARFGECREQDCVYKHTNDDAKECNMYKLGFCPNGPDCRYRHQKMPGPPPPVEEVFQQTQQWASTANGAYANRHSQQRHNNYHHQVERSQWQQPSAGASQRPPGSSSLVEDSQNQQQTHHLLQQQPNQNQTQSLNPLSNGLSSQPNTVSAASPLPQGHSRYFIVKSNNRENLELSVQQGMWATQRNNEGKLNEAFDSCENIILIFSVNRTRHFQGCAKMTSKIGGFVGGGGWKYAHGTAHYGRNFCLKWLKLCELSFYKTRHLRNPYNENLPVKISRDCQELEPSIGEQLASLLYLEPDSELMAIAWAVESKREDEKAQGVNSTPENEDPNIVPFEDNDDDQDEDESDEEESSSQTLSANQGRGRGRGIMWPPHGPMARGGRGMAGSKPMGFHPVMVGGDGYGFDMLGMRPAEGFAMPDMFSTPAGPSQGFPTYGHQGPRFASPEFSNLAPPSGITFSPMDGSVSAPGMVFHGRPPTHNGMFPHGGPRMMVPGSTHAPILGGSGGPSGMMGAVRPHFMGGPGAVGHPIRLTAMPYRPPQGGNSVKGRRDQKRRRNERNNSADRLSLGMDQRASGKSRQMQSSGEGLDADSKVKFHGPAGPQHQDGFENHNYAANHDDDSESEDEAPRRSRHGESKKKRRDWDGEEGNRADHWELPLTGVNPEDGAH